MLAYKITRTILGLNRSLFTDAHAGGVYYEVGQTTKPQTGFAPPQAFDTLRHMQDFYNEIYHQDTRLWECEVVLAQVQYERQAIPTGNADVYRKFALFPNTAVHTESIYPGTLWVDSILPLRRVNYYGREINNV